MRNKVNTPEMQWKQTYSVTPKVQQSSKTISVYHMGGSPTCTHSTSVDTSEVRVMEKEKSNQLQNTIWIVL